jgi:hypothetical protein
VRGGTILTRHFGAQIQFAPLPLSFVCHSLAPCPSPPLSQPGIPHRTVNVDTWVLAGNDFKLYTIYTHT